MPACPSDNQCLTSPPPGFAKDNTTLKRVQLIDLLEKVIDKCQREPQLIEQQPKQTDLLVSIAQFILLSPPPSPSDKRDFLNSILTIGKDLLIDENQVNNEEITLQIDASSTPDRAKDTTTSLFSSTPPNNDNDGDLSLDDLANEYLRNDPSPPSSNEKEISRSISSEPDSTLDDNNKTSILSAPTTDIISKLLFAPLSTEPLTTKPQLESILFSNVLSIHNDEDCMWKDDSSVFGQMLCSKPIDPPTKLTKRVSTCLLDRSLYERLTRLITLLPKECIRTNPQQLSVRPNNGPQYRSQQQRSNNDNRRPSNRPSFQQNSSQMYNNQRYPPTQNVRQYMNPNYSNQNNAGGHFIDRRSQQQQQQNRYPPAPYAGDHQQYQQRGPAPKHNPHSGGQQPQPQQQQQHKKKNPPNDNQQGSNQQQQQQQQRGPKKSYGGNKFNNDKSGPPGSGPSLNPK